jgi:hypothetical protein
MVQHRSTLSATRVLGIIVSKPSGVDAAGYRD